MGKSLKFLKTRGPHGVIPPGSFHSQFEDQVGFHVYQMPGPCPPIQKLNLRLADSTHLSTSLQKEDTRVHVFLQTAMPVASLSDLELARCPGSWVSGAWPRGRLPGRQDRVLLSGEGRQLS